MQSRAGFATTMLLTLFSMSAVANEQSTDNASETDTIVENIAATSLDVVVSAEPIHREPPRYPRSAAKKRREGWAIVSFVVDEEGNVVDPIVESSSGTDAFERVALDAVEDWKYKSATLNGKPIEQCKNRVRLDFKIGGQKGVTRTFSARYTRALEAIAQNDLESAATLLSELGDRDTRTWDENSYFWVAKSYYYEATKDNERYYKALKNVYSHGQGGISDGLYLTTMKRLFAAHVDRMELRDAMDIFKHMQKIAPSHEITVGLMSHFDQISHYIDSEEIIRVDAILPKRGSWSHKLARSDFSVNVPDGQIDKIDIRCSNKRSSYTSVSENSFSIPAVWGECIVYASGKEGTQFTLFETKKAQNSL